MINHLKRMASPCRRVVVGDGYPGQPFAAADRRISSTELSPSFEKSE